MRFSGRPKISLFSCSKEHDQNTTTEKHKNCTVIAELITIKKEPESKRGNIIVEIFVKRVFYFISSMYKVGKNT